MKLMERVYTGITMICILGCAALVAVMVGESRRGPELPEHTPPLQLQQQMPEPRPELDPTALHTGPAVLDETALTAQLVKLMPKKLGVKKISLTVQENGQVGLKGTLSRDGLLDWLEEKGAQVGGTLSPLRVLLPENISFDLALRADRAAGGGLRLLPVSASVAGLDLALPPLPEQITQALAGALDQTLAANGWDRGALEFRDGSLVLG